MSLWEVLSYAAWMISGLLLVWIVIDALNVSREFDEELLIRSRDSGDQLLEQIKQEEGVR